MNLTHTHTGKQLMSRIYLPKIEVEEITVADLPIDALIEYNTTALYCGEISMSEIIGDEDFDHALQSLGRRA